MRNNAGSNARRVTLCAMFCALGVVLMYLGSIIEVLDLSTAVLASLLGVIVVIEYGGPWPWAVWGVTGVLSLILLPNKLPGVMYVLFFGFYPLVKEKIESLPKKGVQWVLKMTVFNVALAILLVLMNTVLLTEEVAKAIWELQVIAALLANVVFVVYDIAMTRLISLYLFKLRRRFRIGK